MGKRGRPSILPIKGEKFGEWTLTGEYERRYKSGEMFVQAFCKCSPSIFKFVRFSGIKNGSRKGCNKCRGGQIENARSCAVIPPKDTVFGDLVTTGNFKWGRGKSRELFLEVKCGCDAGTVCYKPHWALKNNKRPGCMACRASGALARYKMAIEPYNKDGTNVSRLKNTKPYRNNSNGYRGVTWDKTKFVAQITFRYKIYRLGRFDKPEDAHAAYLDAKELLHGAYIKEFNEKYKPKVPIEINYEGCRGK